MKEYVIDDNEVYYSGPGFQGDLIAKGKITICHYESSDADQDPESIPVEQQNWSATRVLAELTSGGGIQGIPGLELRWTKTYADGVTPDEVKVIRMDPCAAYSLYQHFKKIDEENPDGVFW